MTGALPTTSAPLVSHWASVAAWLREIPKVLVGRGVPSTCSVTAMVAPLSQTGTTSAVVSVDVPPR